MTHLIEQGATWLKREFLGAASERQLSRIRKLYELGLTAVTLGRGVPRLINGQDRVRISVHHRYVDEIYEPEVFALLKRDLGGDDIFFDIGAYIGLYSIILSRRLNKNGKVYAFEPAPESRKLLEQHLKLNGANGKVEVVTAAVGEKCGRAEMFTMGDHIQNSLSKTALGANSTMRATGVDVVSLDAFCAERSVIPKWVKVDTEGWELRVLQGAAGIFCKNHSVRFIVEMHPYAWQSAGYDACTFRKYCAEHCLRVEPLSGQKDVFGEYGQVIVSAYA